MRSVERTLFTDQRAVVTKRRNGFVQRFPQRTHRNQADRLSFSNWRSWQLTCCRSCVGWLLAFALVLAIPFIPATAQLTPPCPGQWTPAAGGGSDCRCPDGSFAQAYEAGGQLRFACQTNQPPPQQDSRVHCGGGRYCPQGTKCSRNRESCLHADAVDCGNYSCQPGNTCARGWRGCVAQHAVDCGPQVKGTCAAGTACFTSPTDELKGYERGKTYCVQSAALPQLEAQVREAAAKQQRQLKEAQEAQERAAKEKQAAEQRKLREQRQLATRIREERLRKEQLAHAEKRRAAQEKREAIQRQRQQQKEVAALKAREQQRQKKEMREAKRRPAKAKAEVANRKRDDAKQASRVQSPASTPGATNVERLNSAKREVVDLQGQLDQARTKHAQATERSRQDYLRSSKDVLKLATDWNKARSAGDIAGASELHVQLQTAKQQADRHFDKLNTLKANTVDPTDAAKIQANIAKAKERVATLETERPPARPDTAAARPPVSAPAAAPSPSSAAVSPPPAKAPASAPVPLPSIAPSGPKSAHLDPKSDRPPVKTQGNPTIAAAANPAVRPRTAGERAAVKDMLEKYHSDTKTIKKVAEHADHALIAKEAYYPDRPLDERLTANKWQRLPQYTDPHKGNGGSNVATVYQKGNEVVVAFQGTAPDFKDWKDWKTNVFLSSDQIDWARKTARKMEAQFPGKTITFVGHSMGGRLAQVARTEVGASAVIFDSAPLSFVEGAKEVGARWTDKERGSLTSFRSPYDPASFLSGGRTGPVNLGPASRFLSGERNVVVRNFIPSPIIDHTVQNHSMDQLADAMDDARNVHSFMD